jgi:hypothetical protein
VIPVLSTLSVLAACCILVQRAGVRMAAARSVLRDLDPAGPDSAARQLDREGSRLHTAIERAAGLDGTVGLSGMATDDR